jgi:hypothetical protein
LVARISKTHDFLPVQQTVALGHVMHVARGASYDVHQARVCIRTYVGFHAKVHLLPLFAGVHVRIALVIFVLGGAGRSYQGGINYGAYLEQQALGCQ